MAPTIDRKPHFVIFVVWSAVIVGKMLGNISDCTKLSLLQIMDQNE